MTTTETKNNNKIKVVQALGCHYYSGK